MFVRLFYRQMMYELLPANLVPVLEAEEWKQVTFLLVINSVCVYTAFLFLTSIPSNLRRDHPQRMVCGAIWWVPMKIASRCWSMHKQTFVTFLFPWSWHWSGDLHIRTWLISCGDIQYVQKWTSYVKAFESCLTYIHTYIHTDRLTDRQMPSKLYTMPLQGWSIIPIHNPMKLTATDCAQHWLIVHALLNTMLFCIVYETLSWTI